MSASKDKIEIKREVKCFSTADESEVTYEIEELIGKGSFWKTYLGRKKQAKTAEFVIKELINSTKINEETVREVAAFYRNTYRNERLVQVVGYNLEGVMIMERGMCTLEFYLKHQGRPLSQKMMGHMIFDIGMALDTLREHNFWYFEKNLTSSIVLFKSELCESMTFKLSNFGLSKLSKSELCLPKPLRWEPKNEFFTSLASTYYYAATLKLLKPIQDILRIDTKELGYEKWFSHIFEILLEEMTDHDDVQRVVKMYRQISEKIVKARSNKTNFFIIDTLRSTKYTYYSMTSDIQIHDVLETFADCWLINNYKTRLSQKIRMNELRGEILVLGRRTTLNDIENFIRLQSRANIEVIDWPEVNELTSRSAIHEFLNRGRKVLEDAQQKLSVVKKMIDILKNRQVEHDRFHRNLQDRLARGLEIKKSISSYFEISDEDLFAWDSKKFDIDSLKNIVEKCFAWKQLVENELLCSGYFENMLLDLRKVAEKDLKKQQTHNVAQKLLDVWVNYSDPNLEAIVDIGVPELSDISDISIQFMEKIALCDSAGIGESMTQSLIESIIDLIPEPTSETEVEWTFLCSFVLSLLQSEMNCIKSAMSESGSSLCKAFISAQSNRPESEMVNPVIESIQICCDKLCATSMEPMEVDCQEEARLIWTPWDGCDAYLTFDQDSLISKNGKSNTHLVKSQKQKDRLLDGVRMALKLYNDEMSWLLSRERLINEVTVLSKCRSSLNIVELYGIFGENSGMNGVVLEYCDQGTLDKVIHDKAEFSYKDQSSFCHQAARAVAYLYEQKIIHRDIKPSNMLLKSRRNRTRLLKLCDFGYALDLSATDGIDKHSPQMGFTEVGTKGYMAPEICKRKMYFLECDVYSLGVSMWEIMRQSTPVPDSEMDLEDCRVAPRWMKDVVKRMTAENDKERPSMTYVLEIFDKFHLEN